MKTGRAPRASGLGIVEATNTSAAVTEPAVSLLLPELRSAFQGNEPSRINHGGASIPGLGLAAFEASRLVVRSSERLHFDEPFGEGLDRHTGVRAASALVQLGTRQIIGQDDSNFAAVIHDGKIEGLRLFPNVAGDTYAPERGNKAQKPDIELGATFSLGGQETAVLFGSGSTAARMRAAWIREVGGALVAANGDITSLYTAAMKRLGIGPDVLNLEGCAPSGDKIVFFQRGNGAGGVNASFAVKQKTLEAALLEGRPIEASDIREVRRYDLSRFEPEGLGFSDAAPLPDGRILFLAAAEDSPNTFDDGAILGSVLGVMDADGNLSGVTRVPDGPDGPYKLEGLTVLGVEGGVARVMAVEDADDPAKASMRLVLDYALP
ncbi:MAG: hypothetical protein U1E65_20930 [Myxococcota bacterium]